jgi:hypothetical protein
VHKKNGVSYIVEYLKIVLLLWMMRNIKYKPYQKFEPKILVWFAISAEGYSKSYISDDRSQGTVSETKSKQINLVLKES